MSILTLAQIKAEITAGLGNRTDLASRLNTFVDLSQLRIARKHEFDELRMLETVTTAVTADAEADKVISFPSLTNVTIKKLYSMRRASSDSQLAGKLVRIHPRSWDERIPEPEYYARGYPTHYTVWANNQFELWRVPDAVYTLRVRLLRWPKAASVTGEGNPIDLQNVDDLVINLSLSYAYHSLGRQDKAKDFFAIYSALAKDAMIEDTTDLDEHISGRSLSSGSAGSLGYNDPFVRSIAGDLGYET